jgi:hypothetical protein
MSHQNNALVENLAVVQLAISYHPTKILKQMPSVGELTYKTISLSCMI